MKMLAATMLAAGILVTPAAAQDQGEQSQATRAEVVERDADGRATKIRVEGRVYDVCDENSTDGCINPREAGLDFGGVPIDYWPGRPASEIDGPLPLEPTKPD